MHTLAMHAGPKLEVARTFKVLNLVDLHRHYVLLLCMYTSIKTTESRPHTTKLLIKPQKHIVGMLALSLSLSLSPSLPFLSFPYSFQGEIQTDDATIFELAACAMHAQHGDYKTCVYDLTYSVL